MKKCLFFKVYLNGLVYDDLNWSLLRKARCVNGYLLLACILGIYLIAEIKL